jgi:threonine dehydrogenase-like Zn-dependent dehydrogenase
MHAVVFHGIGDIRLDQVPDPTIQQPTDAIIRITTSAICGTDLHMIRGTVSPMKPGTILGHEAVGIVEEIGPGVRNLRKGDRVVVPSTISCGACSYCRAGYTSQCDKANPGGPTAGTAFYGGPENSGSFNGLQAEYARIPFANVDLIKLPNSVTDEQAILISDIFPTGYFGADCAEITDGDTVAVFGCGPVGQFAIASARLLGARRIFAIDRIPSRLEMARSQGAEVINFDKEHPVQVLQELTNGIGPDRVIDAVGVDAVRAGSGPAAKESEKNKQEFDQELQKIAPQQNPQNGNWIPGNAPSQVLEWAVEAVCKAGTISIIGVYPETAKVFPVGKMMNKNLTVNGGNCNHLRYEPKLVELVASGAFDPTSIITQTEPLTDVIEAFKSFDKRENGWIKVELKPVAATR